MDANVNKLERQRLELRPDRNWKAMQGGSNFPKLYRTEPKQPSVGVEPMEP